MSNTPRGAPELVASQAVPESTVNEAIRRTEAGAARFPVASRVTAPPGSCADGASYIIIAAATGVFTGKENQLATAAGTNAASGWYYRVLGAIDEGALAYVQDTDVEYKWSGSAWAVYGGTGYAPGGTDVAVADGGTGASTAAGARTNLGATTVGGNIFTLTNPSAITFLRMNADNSVDALSASAFRTAISAGSGGGDLLAANNLSDLASAATARTNLGVRAAAPAVQAVASAATVTPTFADDQVNITAQAAGLTLANPTGTAVDGWGLAIRIKDNGTARAITFGTQYRALGVTLPVTTVISKMLYLGCIWNAADTKFDVVAVAQEA